MYDVMKTREFEKELGLWSIQALHGGFCEQQPPESIPFRSEGV